MAVDPRAFATVQVQPGLHASATTAFHPLEDLEPVLRALGVRTVVALTLQPDRRLARRAPDIGVAYVHFALRAGSRPSWARRAQGIVAAAARGGVTLVVGETLEGPALKLARHVADGTQLPTKGRQRAY